MSKIKVRLVYFKNKTIETEVYISSKIGVFIKSIIDKIDNEESTTCTNLSSNEIDILNTTIIYDCVTLDHSKTFENYTFFQYKKTDVYELYLNIKYYKVKKFDNIPRSLPQNIDLHPNPKYSQSRSSISSSPNEEHLKRIEDKLDLILSMLQIK